MKKCASDLHVRLNYGWGLHLTKKSVLSRTCPGVQKNRSAIGHLGSLN